MKKVININFQGRVVPIEETAYDILKQYVESLRRYFDNEEGKDEIINDIEGRIAELFGETLKKGSTCITDDDVNAIIKSMGRPEEFEAEEASVKSQLSGESKQQQSYSNSSSAQSESTAGPRTTRLFRDENNKLLGGVCAGIANYFGIDKLIVRILFVLGFGITFIPYLILWVAVPSTASTVIGSARKRLFRDPDNKWIAGVCGGLASYFGVNVWIPRVLFLIPFLSFVTSWNHWGVFNFPNFLNLSFSPGATIIYIILWLILPEAVTTSDKLEMKGEKVDMNSIKNTIQKDMEGFGERAKEFGKEVGEKAAELGSKIGERSKTVGTEAGTIARKTGTTIGDVISLIFKIFAYIILALVLFVVVVALFALGIFSTGLLLPLKEYLFNDGWQTLLVWGALVLFIWVPVIGIITWIVRRIAKVKSNSGFIRYTFLALWLIGLFCLIGLIASVSNDFQYHNTPVETTVKLSNPSVSKLELKDAPDARYYVNNSWLNFGPFPSIDQDTVRVKNIRLRIMKSETDSFQVTMLKMASGANRNEAEERVSNMSYNIKQRDSLLEFERGFAITPKEKFRNQIIYVTVYVPVGKRIYIDRNTYWNDYIHIGLGWEMNDWDWRNEGTNGYDWESEVEYIMTENGIKPTHPVKEENTDDNNNNNDNKDNKDINKDTLKNSNDSTRYHYQPAKKEEPKSEIKAGLMPAIEKHFFNVDMHDLASTLLGSATI